MRSRSRCRSRLKSSCDGGLEPKRFGTSWNSLAFGARPDEANHVFAGRVT